MWADWSPDLIWMIYTQKMPIMKDVRSNIKINQSQQLYIIVKSCVKTGKIDYDTILHVQVPRTKSLRHFPVNARNDSTASTTVVVAPPVVSVAVAAVVLVSPLALLLVLLLALLWLPLLALSMLALSMLALSMLALVWLPLSLLLATVASPTLVTLPASAVDTSAAADSVLPTAPAFSAASDI
jgi:hypothetical protein